MSQDVRAVRCEELADPVSALMVAVVTANAHSQQSLVEVISAAEAVRAIADQGSAGVTDPGYVEWVSGASAVLTSMIEAAHAKDTAAVWEAFSHPNFGVHRLAAVCEGQPRWAAPTSS